MFSGSHKGSIVPPMPLGERERERARSSVFCLLFLIFFQLSGQDLRGSADTSEGPDCHQKASCVQLFAQFANTCCAFNKKRHVLPRKKN